METIWIDNCSHEQFKKLRDSLFRNKNYGLIGPPGYSPDERIALFVFYDSKYVPMEMRQKDHTEPITYRSDPPKPDSHDFVLCSNCNKEFQAKKGSLTIRCPTCYPKGNSADLPNLTDEITRLKPKDSDPTCDKCGTRIISIGAATIKCPKCHPDKSDLYPKDQQEPIKRL